MGDFLKDKVYEEMNWLEVACRPVICSLNAVLDSLPDKIEITKDMLIHNRHVKTTWPDDIIINLDEAKDYDKLNIFDKKRIKNCFQFSKDNNEETIKYNAETDELIGGPIYLVKNKKFFTEKEIESRIGEYTIKYMLNIYHRSIRDVRHINELLELFSLDEAKKSRSKHKKLNALKNAVVDIFQKNKWQIYNVELSNKFGIWVKEFIINGNMAALANICKLKAMTHSGEPIYSIEEEII